MSPPLPHSSPSLLSLPPLPPLPGLIRDTDDSLFTYSDGRGPLDYHDSDWLPAFTSDLIASAGDDVIAACTPAGASEPLEQCVFDAVATGDINIGMATMDTLDENTLAMTESSEPEPA